MAWTWSNLIHHTRALWNPQNRSKIVALFLWLTLFLAYEWYTLSHGLNQLDILRQLVARMQSSALGPLLFILVYALQPLIFFPSWLLSIAAGYVYGPTRGFAYLLVAGNLAALVAYGTGYFFGDGVVNQSASQNRLHRYAARLRAHSFETILFMRLLFLPFDALSYLAGFLHLRLPGFLLATLLGSIPGTLAFALFGASIEGGLDGQKLQFNPWNMAFSIGLFAVSILAWRLLRGRFGGEEHK
jgi:uncharacterized membrane protein YdjX (TVP38/TMEM64 family)